MLCTYFLLGCGLSLKFLNSVFQGVEVLNFDDVKFVNNLFYDLSVLCPI